MFSFKLLNILKDFVGSEELRQSKELFFLKLSLIDVAEEKVFEISLSLYEEPSRFKVCGIIELFNFIRAFIYSIPNMLLEDERISLRLSSQTNLKSHQQHYIINLKLYRIIH